jgi:flagellar biosynthesis chaperone FliJ
MSSLVRRRERIARVRRVEHVQAAVAAQAAELQLRSLEDSAHRLMELRVSLTAGAGMTSADTLSAQGELAYRLDVARFGLGDAIAGARATVATRDAERIEARKRQESAEKLGERAVRQADRRAEHRAATYSRPRIVRRLGEEI